MKTPIAVIGSGQMGAGIAQVFAAVGHPVLLYDAQPGCAARACTTMWDQLEKRTASGKVDAAYRDAVRTNLRAVDTLSALAPAMLAIEAIVENTEIKCRLFSELDAILPPAAILASNTSSISITRLAAATQRPERVIGMHFMNPVPVMSLVEIIRATQTSDDAYASALDYVKTLGKTAVTAIDRPGFIVNRILVPMINEAIFVLQEGVAPTDIDNAMKLGTNQPMGPLQLADFVGLDTLLSILQILHRELGEDKYRPAPLLVKYVEAGWFGKKSGRGFYTYKR